MSLQHSSRAVGTAIIVAALLGTATAPALHAQGTAAPSAVADPLAGHIAAGDRESAARRSAAALAHFERALAVNPGSYAALWRASREAVDLGEAEATTAKRDGYYRRATEWAQRAVAVNPADAEGHFHLSRALGRTALSVGVRERVKYAADVRTHALHALERDPRHPGALHVLGVWNAEVMRLNGVSRMVAKAFLGGQVFGAANWADATRYMEQSAAIEPNRLVHLLDLARVYRDTRRTADARASYEAALRSPVVDANDESYRRSAASELKALR